MASDYLFDEKLLMSDEVTTVPSHLTVCPLSKSDYERGYDRILFPLASNQDPLSHSTFNQKFELMKRQDPKTYYTIVMIDDGERVVASSTLLLEHKFLRGGSLAGHIEDVVVAPTHQGQNLGRVMIHVLTTLAKTLGCYKVILDCSPENVGFYQKCGYESKGIEMKKYL